MKIYITGVSGTGKSVIAKELSKRSVVALDIEEVDGMCNWVDKKTNAVTTDYSPTMDWLNAHDWICNIGKLKKLLKSNQDIIITGVTGNQEQYLNLFDKIFILQCSQETFLKRMETRHLNPCENSYGQHEAEREFAVLNFKDFEEKLIKKGAIPINSERPISEVADQIISKLL